MFKRGDILEYRSLTERWKCLDGAIVLVIEGTHAPQEEGFGPHQKVVTICPVAWPQKIADKDAGEFDVDLFRKIGECEL